VITLLAIAWTAVSERGAAMEAILPYCALVGSIAALAVAVREYLAGRAHKAEQMLGRAEFERLMEQYKEEAERSFAEHWKSYKRCVPLRQPKESFGKRIAG
jgi:hypothetical protein